MRAPRMRVAAVVAQDIQPSFPQQLEGVGHEVDYVSDLEELANYELVVLSVHEADLPELAEQLSARSRRGQIYLHTSLGYGAQVLDPLETTGAVVGAVYQLNERLWATETFDELSETVVSLIIGELGGQCIEVGQSQRARLAAALTYTNFLDTVRTDATTLLAEALGNVDHASELAASSYQPGVLPEVDGPSGLAAQHAAIEEPGVARAFVHLVRRTAEQSRADDIELWALQQE